MLNNRNFNLFVSKRALLILLPLVSILTFLALFWTGGANFDAEAAYPWDPEGTLFSDYDGMVDRLNHIESVSGGKVQLDIFGQSNQGRDLYVASVGSGDVPVVIVTQMHGNEPHGTQAALNLLEDLGTSADPVIGNIRQELTVHVVPRLNPDGSEPGVFQRRNVDPLAPPSNTGEGRYSNYRVGWDPNRYHTVDWSTHPLSEYSEFSILTEPLGFKLGRTFTGSVPHNNEEGLLVDCGKGETMADFPPEVAGNIALVERNGLFNDKAANAQAAGAIGFVLYQADPEATTIPRLNLSSPPDIPATVISRQSALEIINHDGPVTGKFVTNSYPENPVTETRHFVDMVLGIDPLWLIDVHNQGSYISPGGKTVTSSVMWGSHEEVCPDARLLGKKLCGAMMDHMEQFPYAELTQYNVASYNEMPHNTTNGYSIAGIAGVLVEIWNNYTNPRLASLLIDHAYEQLFISLAKTADGTLFDIDPAKAEGLQLRGTSTTRLEAEELIEPLVPICEEMKQEAIQDAVAAIDAIPDTLTMYDKMEVRKPRALVETALDLGAEESDITNLAVLVEGEETIDNLYRRDYMKQSLFELPAPPPEAIDGWEHFARNKHERWYIYDRSINGVNFLPELAILTWRYSDVSHTRSVEYDISGRGYTHLKGYAGIGDLDTLTDYPITFQIHGDGNLIYEAILEFGEDAQFYLLDVENMSSLRFGYYAEETDGGSANRPIFVEPQFLIPINDDMLDAIDDAEGAIAALPESISLLDEAQVQDARSVAEEAFALGVGKEGRIGNLDKLTAAEETIRRLYHELYEIESFLLLGDPVDENQTWFSDFDNPDRWDVHQDTIRSLNRHFFAPLKAYTLSHSPLHYPRYAEWDISGKGYLYIEGYVGISDSSIQMAFPLVFTISGDGAPLFEAELHYGREALFYRLDLEGVDILRVEWVARDGITDDGPANRPVYVEPLFLHSPKTVEAISLAEDAIHGLPDLAHLTLEDKADVEAARAVVNNALAIGVPEGGIGNLDDLVAAEGKIADLTGDILFGDVDGNGSINVADAILLLRHIIGFVDLEQAYGAEALIRARVSCSHGAPAIEDAILILQYVLDLIEQFPVQ